LFDLRIRTERLELRLPTDPELDELVEVVARGVHGPDEMPFLTPWTRQPQPGLGRSFLQFHWRHRAVWSSDEWFLELGVFHEGRAIGSQALLATCFGLSRTVRTGSWLGREHHGQGLGTEMRVAVLALAFDHLGAVRAESGYLDGNDASMGVSRSIGYQPDGTRVQVVEGVRRVEQRVSLDIGGWRSMHRPHVEVTGLDRCRDLFGIFPAVVRDARESATGQDFWLDLGD
jgi:RimJ/RimL family protein N-acetyltransferase